MLSFKLCLFVEWNQKDLYVMVCLDQFFAGPVAVVKDLNSFGPFVPPLIKRKFIIYGNPRHGIPASLQYCLPSHVCLLGGTKSSLGMTSRHHEAVNKQEKELVHYY